MKPLTFGLPIIKDPVTDKWYYLYRSKMLDATIIFSMLRRHFEASTGIRFDDESGTFNINYWYRHNPEQLTTELNKAIDAVQKHADLMAKMQAYMSASNAGYNIFMQSIRDYYTAKRSYDWGGIACIDSEVTFCAAICALVEKIDFDAFIGDDIEDDIRDVIFQRMTELLQCSYDDICLNWLAARS